MSSMNPIRATIDIGSNTVLLLLAEVSPFKELAKLSEVTSLGKKLDETGVFDSESMAATLKALTNYKNVCESHGVKASEIIATATEAARVAKNAQSFFAQIHQDMGIRIQVITGKAEAELTTKGILFNSTFDTEEVFVMDVGGASTELIRVNTKTSHVMSSVSLPVGSVRVSDWLANQTFNARLNQIFSSQNLVLDNYKTATLYCVAGTLTSLANMHLGFKTFEEDEVHGLRLKTDSIDELLQLYGSWTPAQFLNKFPFLGKRSNAILGGMTLVHHLLHRLGVEEVVVSTYGLRYGTFLDGGVQDVYLA